MNLERIFYFNYENIKKIFLTTDEFSISIDGFSLMLEIVSNKHMNWMKINYKDESNYNYNQHYQNQHQPVYLHFIYCLERFLAMLLKLKNNIKIIFYDSFRNLIKSNPDLYLANELMIFHLKNLNRFELIFTSIDFYETRMTNERIAAYLTFCPIDVCCLNDDHLNELIQSQLVKAILINIRMGINTFLTKDFWYNSDYANAILVDLNRDIVLNVNDKKISIDLTDLNNNNNNNFNLNDIKLSRNNFYFKSLETIDSNFKHYFIIHLYLLEQIPLINRKMNPFDLSNETLIEKYPILYEQVKKFKLNLAILFNSFNQSNTCLNEPEHILKSLLDIFDSRLFFKTVLVLKKIKNNFQSNLMDEHFYTNLFNNQDVVSTNQAKTNSNLKQYKTDEPIVISGSVNLNNKLFNKYLNEFKFEHELSIEDNLNRLIDSNLNEFQSTIFDKNSTEKSQKEKTKFAFYLENYSKSFQIMFKSNKLSESDLKNVIEQPKLNCDEKKAKKADKIIYENLLKNYEKQLKIDKEKIKQFIDKTKIISNIKNLNQSLIDLEFELKNRQTFHAKIDLVEMYLNLLLKKMSFISNSDINAIQQAICDYYQVAQASIRYFQDEKLCVKIRTDFCDILKMLKLIDNKSKSIDQNENEMIKFQLNEVQFHLNREHYGRVDKRVDDFIPDAWQINLMDKIDQNESCIVVAPTSSGKTFASFYAFKKILTSNTQNDFLVVYVAPTKALINQMLASIYSKYKHIEPGRGKKLLGVFTRDHVENVNDSRILLTVPECLEIIYFDSIAYKQIASNIKYIIFDEFQGLNDEKRGITWERIILFCQCPFLALSATIKNARVLNEWLNSVKNIKINLIEYNQPSTEFAYKSFKKNDKSIELKEISPLTCLNGNLNDFNNLIPNITLTPKDTLYLYEKTRLALLNNTDLNLIDLNQFDEFKNKLIISRNNVKSFYEYLKLKLNNLANENSSKYEDIIKNEIRNKNEHKITQSNFHIEKDLPLLVEHLNSNDLLPCLMFSFDRNKLEKCTRVLHDYYQNKEKNLRDTVYKEKIEQLIKFKCEEDVQRKKKRDKVVKNLDEQKELNENFEIRDYSLLDNFLPECILGESKYYTNDEIEKTLNKAFQDTDSEWKKNSIKRGFFYHHGGLNNKKRTCVEAFLRTKYIKLVFCTTTLAQGIHVPCKSVIFLDNSSFLDANTFKQCAGRGGRRGLDTHANIIFLNIPEIKIKYLISSSSSEIKGNFLITISFILKLLNLLSSKSDLVDNSLNILQNSLSNFINKSNDNLTKKFYFLFCSDFLYNQGLIKKDGSGIGLFNLTTRLHYHEPGNFVLHYLIKSGLFNWLCMQENDKKILHQNILLILAYLFNRNIVYNWKKKINKQIELTYNSKIVLNDLPDSFSRAIDEYNNKIHELFVKNLKEQNKYLNDLCDLKLPLSNYDYSKCDLKLNGDYLESYIFDDFEIKTDIVSNFAALSGLHDDHANFHIKDKSLFIHLKDKYLDMNDLYPTLEVNCLTDYYGNAIKLNSYLVDFYNHKSYKCLLNENGLRDDMAFSYLEDFKNILEIISKIKDEYSTESDVFLKEIKQICLEFKSLFSKQFGDNKYRILKK